jgi:hypothetical protein
MTLRTSRVSTLSMAVLVGCVLAACGGTVATDPTGFDPDDTGGDSRLVDTGLRPRDSGLDARVDSSGRDTSVARDTFIDPGCPDVMPPPPDFACDPFEVPSRTCAPGEGCFPFVSPSTGPCDPETYSANCFPAGDGRQGAPCGDGGGCAAGFVCVVSGAGNQCGAICHVGTPGACEDGFVCSPVDVPGIGVCL